MSHNIRRRLLQGELLLGTMVTLHSQEVSELLAEAGFDLLCIDSEHAPLDLGDMQAMLQAASGKTPCIIRVRGLDEAAIKHALDGGATGILAPQIHTAEQAALVVQWARYPPAGKRGLGIVRANHYGFQVNEYLQQEKKETLVVVQAESSEAAQNIEAILRVPGLDAVLIGPYDLSASLGHPGDLEHPDVRLAIQRVTSACQGAGMPLGIFGMTAEAVRPYMDEGFRLILIGVDIVMLGTAARELLRAARS
jgi:2-keto-3-deoxy-L-rhamnonate aldolase RhmA